VNLFFLIIVALSLDLQFFLARSGLLELLGQRGTFVVII